MTTPTTPPTPGTSQIDQLFAEWDRWDSPGVALAILQEGALVYKRGYGCANLEYRIPITPTTIFHVASVSKQFTAAAIVLLAQQGKLGLDDDIRQHLPYLPDFGQTITIRHLAHHTSGLRDQWELLTMAGVRLDDVITQEHIIKMVKAQRELNFAPGEQYLYCNTGYTLMAEIVKAVSGQSFPEFTDSQFFKPLGMVHTHFHDDHEMIVPNRAYSYAADEKAGFKKRVLSYANAGATSLFTTVEDLMRWIQNFADGRIGGKPFVDQMQQQAILNSGETIDYAFGLSVRKYRGLTMIGHSGGDAGFRSHLVRFPEQNFAVVILSNLASMLPGELCLRVADLYLAEQLGPNETPLVTGEIAAGVQPAPPTLSAAQLAAYAGDYTSPELGTIYTMVVQDDKLLIQHRRHSDIVLTPTAEHQFTSERWWVNQVVFTQDATGDTTGFALSGGRVKHLQFEKTQPTGALYKKA